MFVETSRHESYSFALSTAPRLAMAQEQLRDVWLHAQHGRLCAWEQAKALALREASRELHGRTQLVWIAARVEKAGVGIRALVHCTSTSMSGMPTTAPLTHVGRSARSHDRVAPAPPEAECIPRCASSPNGKPLAKRAEP